MAPTWTFRAGAPLSGVAATRSGAVAVLSQDGYLHLLDGDGRHRMSHVLDGPAVGVPVFLAGDAVAASTRSGRVVLVGPDGTRQWSFQVPAPLLGLAPGEAQGSSLVVATRTGGLYSLSIRGATRWRISVPTPELPPIAGPAGPLLLARDGWLVVVSPAGTTRRERLGGRPAALPAARADGWVGVVLDRDLVVLDATLQERFTRRGVLRAAAGDRDWVGIDETGALRVWDDTGAELGNGAPSVDATMVTALARLDTWTAMTTAAGLSLVDGGPGRLEGHCGRAGATGVEPLRERRRLLVSGRDGTVCAFDLPSRPSD